MGANPCAGGFASKIGIPAFTREIRGASSSQSHSQPLTLKYTICEPEGKLKVPSLATYLARMALAIASRLK